MLQRLMKLLTSMALGIWLVYTRNTTAYCLGSGFGTGSQNDEYLIRYNISIHAQNLISQSLTYF